MNTIKEYITNSKELTQKEKSLIQKMYENTLIHESDADLESILDQLLEKNIKEDDSNE
jgi:hypothetical protein